MACCPVYFDNPVASLNSCDVQQRRHLDADATHVAPERRLVAGPAAAEDDQDPNPEALVR